jgi:hypothetical protein
VFFLKIVNNFKSKGTNRGDMPKVLLSIDISSFVIVIPQGKVMYDLYGNVTICSAHEERAPDCEEYLHYFYMH